MSLAGKLVISEIMYHPAAPASSFVEIHNRSATETLPLGGLRVRGVGVTIGHGRFLEPGGYAVVADSLPGYQSTYGNAEVVVAEFGGKLSSRGEMLSLEVAQGTNWQVLNQVAYSNELPWPAAADEGGVSLQLVDPTQDNAGWATGRRAVVLHPAAAMPFSKRSRCSRRFGSTKSSRRTFQAVRRRRVSAIPGLNFTNAGSSNLTLDGVWLGDEYAAPAKWAFPTNTVIPPGGFLVVWCSETRMPPATPNCTAT